ncbi:MAG: hypothetical protein U9Q88_02755 [Bacillota bacterium]|nr:hypothetical protein [Bacillota bacterium]
METESDGLTLNSLRVVEEFLSYYSEGSRATLNSSIRILLKSDLNRREVADIVIEDFLKLFPKGVENTDSQEKNKHSFFRFIYAFDVLTNSIGFERKFIKENEIKYFQRSKQRLNNPKVKEKKVRSNKVLSLEELTSIQKIIETNSTKMETLKMQFVWHLIFELGIDIEEVRKNISTENFVDGKVITKEDSYTVPEKYKYLFEKLSEGDRSYIGFSTLNDYFEKLGELAKLERKLLPTMAKITRREYMVACGNCGERYTNLSHNWLSVNNRIVCIDCGETLKKK